MRDQGRCITEKIRVGLCLLVLILLFSVGAAAEENGTLPEPVTQARSGIVRVRSVCRGADRVLQTWEHTGFLVGVKGAEPYVITVADGMELTASEQSRLRKKYKLEDNASLSMEISVIFQGDITLEASLIDISEEKSLSILRLNQSLTDKYSLSFSQEEADKNLPVYLLSFPLGQSEGVNSYSDTAVRISPGEVKGRRTEKGKNTRYLLLDISMEEKDFGAPVLDREGCIVGMGILSQDDNHIALAREEILKFLELHNISYSERTGAVSTGHSRWIYLLGAVMLCLLGRLLSQWRKLTGQRRGREGSASHPGAAGRGEARLLYLKKQETIPINLSEFVLGSSPGKADYVIEGNRKVSRVHALISRDSGRYYITDKDSTNGTLLDDARLEAGKRRRLTDGSRIDLAGEQFVFRER